MRRIAGLLSVFCFLSASAAHAEVEAVRTLVTASLSRSHEPRRPLESIRLPSAVYYYVQLKGLSPGRNHQFRVTVLDGAKNVVGDHRFGREFRTAQDVVWFPILPRATHAPGVWTFRMDVDQRTVARTDIAADPNGGEARTSAYERHAPAAGLALLALLAYLGYGLLASRGITVAAAAPTLSIADPALFALVAVNLLPLALAYFGGANAADLLFIYWTENLVIAFYTILRMAMARGPGSQSGIWIGILIFILHFGMFTFMHGGLLMFFVWDSSNVFELSPHGMLNPEIAAEFERQPVDFFNVVPVQFAFVTVALFISHGVSFVQNYIKRGEFLAATPQAEMLRPYNRVAAMHVAAVLTGLFATSRGSPLLMLVLLVAIKTAIDVNAHVRSHAAPRPA
jgi:hypothetical protein